MRSFFVIVLFCGALWAGSCLGKNKGIPDTQVDVLELNHVYTSDGSSLAFTQAIFWTWDPSYCRLVCDYWVIVDTRWDFYVITADVYQVGDMVVRPKAFRETWTRFDPEREDRKLTPEKYRIRYWGKELWKLKKSQVRPNAGGS